MNGEAVQSEREIERPYVRLPVPVGDPEAFRYGATADILHVLVDNPAREFTNRELHRLTGRGLSGVNDAVRSLEALGVIDVDRTGRANSVRIDPDMVVKPADPVLAIPQREYHEPVRAVLHSLDDRLDDEFGVVLFGSVARGTADRASDIDCFVLVESDRMDAQREAHRIENELSDERFSGDRYEPHIIVETRESAPGHDRIAEIISEGLTLRDSAALEEVKREVLESGA